MALFDNKKAKLSLAVLIIGAVVLVALVVLGGVIQAVIKNTAKDRLKFEYPKGFKDSKTYKECWHKKEGEAQFNDKYYMWNLTNPQEVLAGGKANFKVLGPYTYVNWTCDYDWKVEGDFLKYRTVASGYRFIETQSNGTKNDLITNFNPGYLALLKGVGSEQGVLALMAGGAIKQIIDSFKNETTIQQVQVGGFPTVLSGINAQVSASMAAGYSIGVLNNLFNAMVAGGASRDTVYADFFNSVSFARDLAPTVPNVVRGFANWHNLTTSTALGYTISNATAYGIYNVWNTNARGDGLIYFAGLTPAAIATTFGVANVTVAQALLDYVTKYLTVPASLNPTYVNGLFYGQWANLTTLDNTRVDLKGLTGWEVGAPSSPTNFTADVVAALFSTSNPYSLTTTTGIEFWFGALLGKVSYQNVTAAYPTITPAQYARLLAWVNTFHTTINIPMLQAEFGISNWQDFAYVQWGQLAAGQSLGPSAKPPLAFLPEIAALNISAQPSLAGKNATDACKTYTIAEAKALLTSQNGLAQEPTFTALFMRAYGNGGYTAIQETWGIDRSKADCLYAYVRYLMQNAAAPAFQALVAGGSGLLVTRTVDQWLFNAEDPLLKELGQKYNVGVVGNGTMTEEEANTNDPEQLRVYTGKNDLYKSLQPVDYGQTLYSIWEEGITIMGYNGSQFMPYDYVKKKSNEKTLQLWHHSVLRPVGLTYVGMTEWEGVDLAYLALHPDTLAASSVNPDNKKYYSTYGGMINETSFTSRSGLPVFLSLPNFYTADAAVTANIVMEDTIFERIDPTDKMTRHPHQVFLLVEPYLGSAVWGNVPIQANFEVGPTDLYYPKVRPMFAPIYWNAIGDKGTSNDLDTIKTSLYANRRLSKILIGVGAGVGGVMLVAGIIGLIIYRNKYENGNKIFVMKSSTSGLS